MLCNPTSNSRTSSSPQKESPCPWADTPHCPHPQPRAPTICFLSLDSPALDVSYKWRPALWGRPCLASFTQQHVFKDPPCCSLCQGSILFILESCPTVWMAHRLFIHSLLVDIWIVSQMAKIVSFVPHVFLLLWMVLAWTSTCICLNACFQFSWVSRSRLLGYMVILVNLLRNHWTFSTSIVYFGDQTFSP